MRFSMIHLFAMAAVFSTVTTACGPADSDPPIGSDSSQQYTRDAGTSISLDSGTSSAPDAGTTSEVDSGTSLDTCDNVNTVAKTWYKVGDPTSMVVVNTAPMDMTCKVNVGGRGAPFITEFRGIILPLILGDIQGPEYRKVELLENGKLRLSYISVPSGIGSAGNPVYVDYE